MATRRRLLCGPANRTVLKFDSRRSNGDSIRLTRIHRRTFRLTGTGYEPTMPRPTVVIESSAIRSGEQGRVSISTRSASRSNAKGQLRMELRPAGTVKDNDSGAQFVSGSRTVAFDVAPGDTTVKLRGQDSIVFQAEPLQVPSYLWWKPVDSRNRRRLPLRRSCQDRQSGGASRGIVDRCSGDRIRQHALTR